MCQMQGHMMRTPDNKEDLIFKAGVRFRFFLGLPKTMSILFETNGQGYNAWFTILQLPIKFGCTNVYFRISLFAL
jgi:hypothetical protein